MKKLLRGIVDFRHHTQAGYREAFGRLAMGQKPDSLFVACSDSRVVPNTFASTDPGDLFVLRNIGNLVPPCAGETGLSVDDLSEAAALEYSVLELGVSDIIVCGHSECGAMRALLGGRPAAGAPNFVEWLRHGEPALRRLEAGGALDASIPIHDRLSQLNVLQQLDHVRTYPFVRERIAGGKLRLHGWWFELAHADVYAYEPELHRFVLIDETQAERILTRLGRGHGA
ncbi:MAG: carbonic anhydrase [Oligoflexia bacterium]|nr:carbonic anhydrase [Oligoflexia bacterium]